MHSEMIVHEIHNLDNAHVVNLLTAGLSGITDTDIIKNYHPDYAKEPGNLFYILNAGRYEQGQGKYYVLESQGEYVCSAGWNEYENDSSIAFALTRMYTSEQYRGQFLIAQNILTKTLVETESYPNIWLTVNEHNKSLYDWFVRVSKHRKTNLAIQWPEVYRQFKPLGRRVIYNTTQYVVELKRTKMTDQEKLDFIKTAITNLFKKQPKSEVTPDKSLIDLGLDSLDIVELQMHYEEATGEETATDSRVVTVADLMSLMK
jgi:acyl carrier protein